MAHGFEVSKAEDAWVYNVCVRAEKRRSASVRQLSLALAMKDAGTLTPGELQIECDRDPGAVYISVLVGLVRLNADHSPSFSPAVNSPYPSSKQDRVPKTAQMNYEASR